MSAQDAERGEELDTDGPVGVLQEASTLLYAKVKDYIRVKVNTGEWLPGHRLPSENEFVTLLDVSRMTAHRALRELAADGAIIRIRGKGSFVAPVRMRRSLFQGVPNIADEIRQRGGHHSAHVILFREEACNPEISESLGLDFGATVGHSVIVHKEDDLPIQIEDRFINLQVATDYLSQDFSVKTPNEYLTSIASISKLEQSIEAVNASTWECKVLVISRNHPCLLIRRRTWTQEGVVSAVRLLYPGNRYRLESS